MHALIRQGNGKYYVSAVFGYYKEFKSKDDSRNLKSNYSSYYVVFNSGKTHLIKLFAMQPNTKYLIPQLLIVDADQRDWVLNTEFMGGVNFLPKHTADTIINSGIVPDDILVKCLKVDNSYVYNEYQEIINEKDIENLEWASGGFHDAYIKEKHLLEDGTLYIVFDGVWGCSIEVWFWEEVSYNKIDYNPEEDPFWYRSTVIIKDGFIYFVDKKVTSADQIEDEDRWFKARHMKYHIIPD